MDIVPAFATITVFYDLAVISGFARFCAEIEQRVARADLFDGVSRDRIVHEPGAQIQKLEHRDAAPVVGVSAPDQKPQRQRPQEPAVVPLPFLIGFDELAELEELQVLLRRQKGPERGGGELDRLRVPRPPHLEQE